ncbi:MAG: hypothetical protein ACJAZF_002751, partial [Granulosicoccus sp.]
MGKLLAIGYCLFAGITYAAGQKILSENLDFSECSIGSGAVSLAAQCATLTVQLDSRPDSETQQSSNSAKAGTESRVESGSGSGS